MWFGFGIGSVNSWLTSVWYKLNFEVRIASRFDFLHTLASLQVIRLLILRFWWFSKVKVKIDFNLIELLIC